MHVAEQLACGRRRRLIQLLEEFCSLLYKVHVEALEIIFDSCDVGLDALALPEDSLLYGYGLLLLLSHFEVVHLYELDHGALADLLQELRN